SVDQFQLIAMWKVTSICYWRLPSITRGHLMMNVYLVGMRPCFQQEEAACIKLTLVHGEHQKQVQCKSFPVPWEKSEYISKPQNLKLLLRKWKPFSVGLILKLVLIPY